MVEPSMLLVKRRNTRINSADLQILERIERTIDSLLEQKRFLDCIEFINKALPIRKSFYGENSNEVLSFVAQMLKSISKGAGSLLCKENPLEAIKILQNLLKISQPYHLKLIPEFCSTINTLACAYQNTGKYKKAQNYAHQALQIIKDYPSIEIDRSSLYLNLCTIYSNLNLHKEASNFCKLAIQSAKEELVNLNSPKSSEEYRQKITTLGVAYHNLGVEEEFLKNFESSIEWYKKSIVFMKNYSDSSQHQLLESLKKSYQAAIKSQTERKTPKSHGKKSNSTFEKIISTRSDENSRTFYKTFGGPEADWFQLNQEKKDANAQSQLKFHKNFKQNRIKLRRNGSSTVYQSPKFSHIEENSVTVKNSLSRDFKEAENDVDLLELDHLGLLEYSMDSKECKMDGKYEINVSKILPVKEEKPREVKSNLKDIKPVSKSYTFADGFAMQNSFKQTIEADKLQIPFKKSKSNEAPTKNLTEIVENQGKTLKTEEKPNVKSDKEPIEKSETQKKNEDVFNKKSDEKIDENDIKAIIKMQAIIRGNKTRKILRDTRVAENPATKAEPVKENPKKEEPIDLATIDNDVVAKIQAAFRGKKVRKQLKFNKKNVEELKLNTSPKTPSRNLLVLIQSKPKTENVAVPKEPVQGTAFSNFTSNVIKTQWPIQKKFSFDMPKKLINSNEIPLESPPDVEFSFNPINQKEIPDVNTSNRPEDPGLEKISSIDGSDYLITIVKTSQDEFKIRAESLETHEVYNLTQQQPQNMKIDDFVKNLTIENGKLSLLYSDQDIAKITKIQNVFRRKKKQRTISEIPDEILVKGERHIKGQTFLISIIKTKSNLIPGDISRTKIALGDYIRIEVHGLNNAPMPKPKIYTVNELCELLNLWESSEIYAKKNEIFVNVDIENHEIVLRKSSFIEPRQIFATVRVLNNSFKYTLKFFDISYIDTDEDILIEAIADKKAPAIENNFCISRRELSDILGINVEDLDKNFKKVADLIIIEEMREINISKRILREDTPNINISVNQEEKCVTPCVEKTVDKADENKESKSNLRFTFRKNVKNENYSKAFSIINATAMKNIGKYFSALVIKNKNKKKIIRQQRCIIQGKSVSIAIFESDDGASIEITNERSGSVYSTSISIP
ncbi:unnamed protein product [Blepharisma stoltei]|uniref:Tetratricopeptide repeat protein n=1 Tax=Blepharisma stoltei TaxID=1481888 RepID=A0AAU9IMB2_9CILI|nr:unnamed protein product [Blepharisma stoltei]